MTNDIIIFADTSCFVGMCHILMRSCRLFDHWSVNFTLLSTCRPTSYKFVRSPIIWLPWESYCIIMIIRKTKWNQFTCIEVRVIRIRKNLLKVLWRITGSRFSLEIANLKHLVDVLTLKTHWPTDELALFKSSLTLSTSNHYLKQRCDKIRWPSRYQKWAKNRIKSVA